MSRSSRTRRPAALLASAIALSATLSGCGFLGLGGEDPG